jgi:ActR/RegA family two-component response regulator
MGRILVVDSDFAALRCVERLLWRRGDEALTADSGGQALEVVLERAVDVILVDLRLSDMTALDLLRELPELGIGTPCIVMSGGATIQSAVEAMRLGALDYLQKPLSGQDLEDALVRAFAGRPRASSANVRADGVARWARAIAVVLDSPHDPRNLADWSRIRGVAPETLRTWCRTARLLPKRSLDLARLLRAVSQARFKGWPLERLLEASNYRTVARLLVAGGLLMQGDLPTLGQLLERQSLIVDPIAIGELRQILRELGFSLDA